MPGLAKLSLCMQQAVLLSWAASSPGMRVGAEASALQAQGLVAHSNILSAAMRQLMQEGAGGGGLFCPEAAVQRHPDRL